MHERPGSPIFFVERFLDKGTFEKHNSNSGYVNDEHHRNTPQAFSHFTFEMSEGRLIVVDIQGIDDLYTDPAIHSYNLSFGDADLGVRGMALFFASYGEVADNPVSQFLCLPDLEDPEKRFQRTVRSGQRHDYVPYEPATWVNAPLPQSKVSVPGGTHDPRSSRGTGTAYSDGAAVTTPSPRGVDISPRIKTDADGHVLYSASSEVATPFFLTLPVPPKGEVLAEIYAMTADLHDQGRFEPADTPEARAAKGRSALACMAKATELGDIKASLTLSQLYGGMDTAGRLSCCEGTVQVDPVLSMRYTLAAAKRGHQASMLQIAQAAAYGQYAEAPNYAYSSAWYEMILEGDGSFEELYVCQAALAALLTEGGHGLEVDNGRAAELYGEAAEAAMDLGKGKLSMKWSMASEACYAAAEEEDDEEGFGAISFVDLGRVWTDLVCCGTDTADEDAETPVLKSDADGEDEEDECLPEIEAMTARLARVNQLAGAEGGERDEEDVQGWLEAAFAEVCAEEAEGPMRAMAAKCGAKAVSYTAHAAARAWLEAAFAQVSTQRSRRIPDSQGHL